MAKPKISNQLQSNYEPFKDNSDEDDDDELKDQKMEHDSNEGQKSWKKGDHCLAYFEEDGLYYPAKVKEVFALRNKVAVQYAGYRETSVLNLNQILQDPDAIEGEDVQKSKRSRESDGDDEYSIPVSRKKRIKSSSEDDDPKENKKKKIQENKKNSNQEKPAFTFPGRNPKEPIVLGEGVEINACISQYLRDYQIEGIKFLYGLFSQNKGGILGDDMGLGKTIQVISFISAILGKNGYPQSITPNKPILIACPLAVLYNWKREFETWGHFSVEVYHGGKKKDSVIENVQNGKTEIVITTFDTVRLNKTVIDQIKWYALIADEVHQLKEPKTKVTEAFKGLSISRRYGLTGTAIQNTLKELWCLLDWANPNSLGPWEVFDTTICNPILEGQRFNANRVQLTLAKNAKDKLQKILGTVFLRRTKALIADELPKKQDLVLFCHFGKKQEEVYKKLFTLEEFQIINRKDEQCDCKKTYKSRGDCCYSKNADGVPLQKLLHVCITTLQKASNHLSLLMPHQSCDVDERKKKQQERFAKFVFDGEIPDSKEQKEMELDLECSGKLKITEKLLKIWYKKKDKVLVFTHSKKMLDIFERFAKSNGYDYCRLDGSTAGEKRLSLTDEFNTSPSKFIFFISTKAGGLGLNLTSANRVILFDPDWNPSNDSQAQDRAFRIGQTRNVKIYRLIAAQTIEEAMYQRQIYKQQLSNIALNGSSERRFFTGVAGNKNNRGELFGVENLLAYYGTTSTTKEIISRSDKTEMEFKAAFSKDSDQNEKKEPIEDDEEVMNILNETGFDHFHSNSDLFGGSEAEELMKANAEKAVQTRQHLETSANLKVDFTTSTKGNMNQTLSIQTPESNVENRREKFLLVAAANEERFGSKEAFAKFLVNESTVQQRKNILELFNGYIVE